MDGIRCITLSKMILNIWYDLRLDTRRVRIMNGIKYMTFSELKFNIWYDGNKFWGLWMDYNIIHSVNRYLAYDTIKGLIRRKLVLRIFNWIKYITFCEFTLSIWYDGRLDTVEGRYKDNEWNKVYYLQCIVTYHMISWKSWYEEDQLFRVFWKEQNISHSVNWWSILWYDLWLDTMVQCSQFCGLWIE